MQKILIASQNSGKITEIAPILEQAGFEVTDARMHELPEPVEDSGTFIGNARIKAKAAMEATGMAVLADDSGIIVDALGDFPGVESAPHAAEHGGCAGAVAHFFEMLDGKPSDCHYVCILLLMFPDGREIIATGKTHGKLVKEPRGDQSFGHDAWFEIEGSDKTFGEVSKEEKSAISHRGKALQDLLRQLKEL